ncbi:MAG TPA: hotdog fold domain-containing protein [archaeon]|nr:hotdog fold domain-containing protein [archaeon]
MEASLQKSLNHDRCFVCGTHNPGGLGMHFVSEDGITSGYYIIREGLESLNGITHGGILSTLMDAAMARWLHDRGIIALTAILTVRFRILVSPGQQLHVVARKKKQIGRRYYMECKLHNEDRREVASAKAVFCQFST